MKKLSLNFKIIFLLSIFLMASLAVSFVGIQKVGEIDHTLKSLVKGTAQRLFMALEMNADTHQIRNMEKVLILEETTTGMTKVGLSIEKLEKELTEKIDNYRKISTQAGLLNLDTLETKLSAWKLIDLEIRKQKQAGNEKEASNLARGKSRDALIDFSNVLDKMIERNRKLMDTESLEADSLVSNTRTLIGTVSIVSLLLGTILAFFILKSISQAINTVITNLDDSSNQVASAAQQIASSSEELSQATTEQASALEETAASVEEMNSMISKNSENAREASETSKRSHESAKKGKETVEQMIRSIDDISSANNKIMTQINYSNDKIAEIVQVISEIGNKTKVINDIVFQTKLLSFNASVEAARAGEHGKGFAVVAEEVGNLAQMSGNAAKEITEMLDESIKKVEGIVNETKLSVGRLVEEGKQKVDTGTRVAQACGEMIENIVNNITSINSMAEEISTASLEQSQGIGEITKAMNQLDHVTQQNASNCEQTASSAVELSAQADNLRVAVAVLVETIQGQKDNVRSHNAYTSPAPASRPIPINLKSIENNKVLPMKSIKTKLVTNSTEKKFTAPSHNDSRFSDV
ncbi:MAG: methyl-accepting chemotaxis protein [Bacteriovorax sp.]|nr:methyl-accepting chemotaxis protein [Bacteriovorax sp.]